MQFPYLDGEKQRSTSTVIDAASTSCEIDADSRVSAELQEIAKALK
jgi:hypothetical protein